jgi:flagellar motor switch protein FliN
MSDGSLSQDEIDALLQGSGGMDFDAGPTTSSLSDAQRQQFQQLISATAGSQQSNLSMLVSNEVQIRVTSVEAGSGEELSSSLPEEAVQISIDLTEGAPGAHSYVLGADAAVGVAGPMMGQEDIDLDDAAVNALQEAFSQVSGPVITALGDKAGITVMNAPPTGVHGGPDALSIPDGEFVNVTYSVQIGDSPAFEMHELFDVAIVQAVTAGQQPAAQQAAPQAAAAGGFGSMGGGDMSGMGGMPMGGGNAPNVQSVQFPNLGAGSAGSEQGNIGLLMDVYMEMTVELGRTRKLIKEILGMGEGTIIELDKLAGEPVDILVNHKLIAKGEVVVIDENFGVRVTEIVSPMERMSGMP